jgi:hypothetical protein
MGDLFRTCQDGHRCENGSLCAEDPEHEASFYCDCSTATGDFAGLFCEYEAQNYCRFPQEVTSSWFCTNDGTCKVSVNADKSQWNCDCSEEYEGPVRYVSLKSIHLSIIRGRVFPQHCISFLNASLYFSSLVAL